MAAFAVSVDEDEWAKAPDEQRDALRALKARLQADPFAAGDKIRRELVPKKLRSLPNMYRLELRDGWRALYFVGSSKEVPRAVRVVFIGDHKRYDRLFGYSSS